jgi:uncharacterized protein YecT (DUF1311 family)
MVIVCNRSLFNKYGWMAFVCYFENSKGTSMTSRTHTPEDVQKIMEPWRDSASDYERGFIDGMQKQMQSSVDKAVNAIKEALAQPEQKSVAMADYMALTEKYVALKAAQRTWVGLTDEELSELSASGLALWGLWRAIEAKLKEKNTWLT